MERFVKPDVLQANCTGYKLLKLDLTKEVNLLPIESINVGFRAKAKLRELKTTEKTLMQHLWNGAQALLVRVIEKLRERCPLKFKMTRSISCLSPTEISLLKPELMKTGFSSLVQFLHDDGMVASIAAEKAEKQYSQLKQRILIFTMTEWMNFSPAYLILLQCSCGKCCAVGFDTLMGMRVESGFSINMTFC